MTKVILALNFICASFGINLVVEFILGQWGIAKLQLYSWVSFSEGEEKDIQGLMGFLWDKKLMVNPEWFGGEKWRESLFFEKMVTGDESWEMAKSGHFARGFRVSVKQVSPVSVVRMGNIQRVCYECGSSEHLRNTCPNLNRAPNQAGNRLALEGNRNTRNNGNQARGRAFSVNAVDALQDPNVVTGTFSLNDHFANVLLDSGVDFSFISTKFMPLLNVKPSIVCLGYVIEVANDLIPLGHGSFEVVVGMDWLSKNMAEIVCHEKVVRIPLEGGEILRVQGERILGGTKTLMSTKADEPELSDIPVVREFTYVFRK
ncbi:putative reverse transcriptase domain-containing protein [Tanacetum coccineum]